MTRDCATLLRRALALSCAAAALAGCGGPPSADDLKAQADEQWPLVERYCTECHNDAELAAGSPSTGSSPDEHRRARRDVREGGAQVARPLMPPPKEPQTRRRSSSTSFVAWLEASLDAAAAAAPAPGYVTPHRLNRKEYANAVRDLLALDDRRRRVAARTTSAEHGFDNIASALQVSPSFIEQYVSAARNLRVQAVGTRRRARAAARLLSARARTQQSHVRRPAARHARRLRREHYFPSDGEYDSTSPTWSRATSGATTWSSRTPSS